MLHAEVLCLARLCLDFSSDIRIYLATLKYCEVASITSFQRMKVSDGQSMT